MAISLIRQNVPAVISFKSLPKDVLNTVIKNILSNTDYKTLSALGSVSRRLFSILTDYKAHDLARMEGPD
jgi:hypothetical protein